MHNKLLILQVGEWATNFMEHTWIKLKYTDVIQYKNHAIIPITEFKKIFFVCPH